MNHSPDRDTALSIFRPFARPSFPIQARAQVRLEFAELPKTISGKIRRVELRAAEAARLSPDSRSAQEFCEEDFPELHAA